MHIEREIWKGVPGMPTHAVSNKGRVATAHKCKGIGYSSILKPTNNGRGYQAIFKKIEGTKKNRSIYIHRLVAQTFIPNPENKAEVNHIDGNKSNNSLGNLEWVTLQENRNHAKATGLTRRGQSAPSAKLSDVQVLEIVAIMRDNPKGNKSQLGRRYGVNCTTIIKIMKGQRWGHLTGITVNQ